MKKLKWIVGVVLLLCAIAIAGVRIVTMFVEFHKAQKQADELKSAVKSAKKAAEASRETADRQRRLVGK